MMDKCMGIMNVQECVGSGLWVIRGCERKGLEYIVLGSLRWGVREKGWQY